MSAESNPSNQRDQGRGTERRTEEQLLGAPVAPVASIDDLRGYRADIWESDEELETFLARVRASRNADLA
ncbi:MAG TPA: hypothetical protein VHG90_09705 [Acidimicrobiales bacterium]|nr:hypothetical protein [Acidimicrobiales bacterium]